MGTAILSLEALAIRLALPKTYLRKLAAEGAIPSLDVSGRLRFDAAAVIEALRAIAKRRQRALAGAGGRA